VRRVLDNASRHTWEHALHVQPCPTIASVRSGGPFATQGKIPMESAPPCPRELTGENSPHHTNQPAQIKMDRVLVSSFCASTYL
jgi:hypothetical protein